MFIFERESAIQWLRNRSFHGEGIVRKNTVRDNEILSDIQLA